jgi:uncharacterized protein
MNIDIADAVRNEGEVYTALYDGPLQSVDFMGEHFEFPAVHTEAEYRFDGEGLSIDGSLNAEIDTECSRCLEKLRYPINIEFSEYYKKQAVEEDGIYSYESDIIDLTKMLQDNVIINLPMRFLCREDCKGLCSNCGTDLNKSDCGCGVAEKEGPLSRLREFSNDREE